MYSELHFSNQNVQTELRFCLNNGRQTNAKPSQNDDLSAPLHKLKTSYPLLAF